MVAPVRERGLKLLTRVRGQRLHCRSREGAWIEIWRTYENQGKAGSLP